MKWIMTYSLYLILLSFFLWRTLQKPIQIRWRVVWIFFALIYCVEWEMFLEMLRLSGFHVPVTSGRIYWIQVEFTLFGMLINEVVTRYEKAHNKIFRKD